MGIAKEKMPERYGKSEQGNFYVVDSIGVPHAYMITPLHIQYCDGYLNEASIKRAESRGARCGQRECKMTFDEHEHALLVKCEIDPKEAKEEIEAYLKSIVKPCEEDGYVGFTLMFG